MPRSLYESDKVKKTTIFYAYDPLTKSKTLIADSGILLPQQTKSLTHPDRIIRYAKYLKTKFYPNKEVEIRGIGFI